MTAIRVFVELRYCWLSFHESHETQQQILLTNWHSCNLNVLSNKKNKSIHKIGLLRNRVI